MSVETLHGQLTDMMTKEEVEVQKFIRARAMHFCENRYNEWRLCEKKKLSPCFLEMQAFHSCVANSKVHLEDQFQDELTKARDKDLERRIEKAKKEAREARKRRRQKLKDAQNAARAQMEEKEIAARKEAEAMTKDETKGSRGWWPFS